MEGQNIAQTKNRHLLFLDLIHLLYVYSPPGWIEYICSRSVLHLDGLNISAPGLFSTWLDLLYLLRVNSPSG